MTTATKTTTKRRSKFSLDAVKDEHLECRDFSHAWQPYDAVIDNQNKLIERILICERCKTTRHQVITMKGFIHKSSYVYAEGYLLKGAGHVMTQGDRAKIRLRSIQRGETHEV